MKTAILSLVLISSTVFTLPAFAKDSMHLVCAGFMKENSDSDNYGISIIFDEYRSGAETRTEVLSSVFAGKFYQGINSNSDWGQKQRIIIASKENAKNIFFRGQYQVVNEDGTYKLNLIGNLNLEANGARGESISTTLDCVNISN